jgi:hypothetical protein
LGVACQSGKPKAEEAPVSFTETNMVVSAADTLAVATDVNRFMTLAKEKKYSEAASTLFKMVRGPLELQPEPLDNEEMQQVINLLKTFPVRQYSLDYIRFSHAERNEVRCTITVDTGTDEAPFTTALFFNPMRYLGVWKLCLKATGDRPLGNR